MASISINNRLTRFAQQSLVLGNNTLERERIATSLSRLQRVLRDNLYNTASEIKTFGSYTRNTILPRYFDASSDVDMLVIFDTSNGVKASTTYRENILKALAPAYPKSVVKRSFPTVKLELNHIMFDVVPCYKTQDRNGSTFYIPDANGGWRTTVPKDLDVPLSQKNQAYGNNIVRNAIRLCKHWNAAHGRIFDSYELEKWIVNRYFYSGDDLYTKFLSLLKDKAYNIHSGTAQAIDWIEKYQGNWYQQANEQKQLEWLQKLLPGLC